MWSASSCSYIWRQLFIIRHLRQMCRIMHAITFWAHFYNSSYSTVWVKNHVPLQGITWSVNKVLGTAQKGLKAGIKGWWRKGAGIERNAFLSFRVLSRTSSSLGCAGVLHPFWNILYLIHVSLDFKFSVSWKCSSIFIPLISLLITVPLTCCSFILITQY